MGFYGAAYGISAGCLWDAYGDLWDAYGMSMGGLWDVYGMPMGCLWDVCGIPLGCLWDAFGMPAGIYGAGSPRGDFQYLCMGLRCQTYGDLWGIQVLTVAAVSDLWG